MSDVMVDIEADGPIPGDYSIVCFGAVIVGLDSAERPTRSSHRIPRNGFLKLWPLAASTARTF
jgi:hypothetical protein